LKINVLRGAGKKAAKYRASLTLSAAENPRSGGAPEGANPRDLRLTLGRLR
jgi:hypothetical protein